MVTCVWVLGCLHGWKALSLKKLPIESLIKLEMYMGKMGERRGKKVKGKVG